MKTIIISILIIGIFAVKGKCPVANFQGNWKDQIPARAFSLKLNQASGNLKGNHCAITPDGNRIDCALDDTDVSITGTISNADSVIVTVKSFYSNTTGTAVIKKIDDNTISWRILTAPLGVFYIFNSAILIRQ